MRALPIADPRLWLYARLLVPAFVGHAVQLLAEDRPWEPAAMRRYWITPGWHLYLSPYVPLAIAALLALAVAWLALHPTRRSVLVVAALYATHYLTYPWRIRNHMTTMLAGLAVVSLVWLTARASGALTPGRAEARRVDRLATTGLAAVITVTYFFAGLHKLNAHFTDPSLEGPSAAVSGLTTFWIYGDLGSVPPGWAIATAIWGTIVVETAIPVLAWRFSSLGVPCIAVLMLFHLPQVAVMDVADYPLVASAFYPALLTRGRLTLLARHAGPSWWTLTGAMLGAATQVWFMPWWGPLTVLGIFVLALWGWALGAVARSLASARRAG